MYLASLPRSKMVWRLVVTGVAGGPVKVVVMQLVSVCSGGVVGLRLDLARAWRRWCCGGGGRRARLLWLLRRLLGGQREEAPPVSFLGC